MGQEQEPLLPHAPKRKRFTKDCYESRRIGSSYSQAVQHRGIWTVRLMLDKVLKDVKYLEYSSFLYTDRKCNVSHRSVGEICKVTHTCGIPNN